MTIINKLNLDKYKHMAIINQPADYDVFPRQNQTFDQEHDAIFIFVENLRVRVQKVPN